MAGPDVRFHDRRDELLAARRDYPDLLTLQAYDAQVSLGK